MCTIFSYWHVQCPHINGIFFYRTLVVLQLQIEMVQIFLSWLRKIYKIFFNQLKLKLVITEMEQSSVVNHFCISAESATRQNFKMIHTYRPIYIVSRIFGQMPFSIVYHPNGDIHRPAINKLDAVWFLLSMSVFICLMYSAIELFSTNSIVVSRISTLGNIIIFGISCILGLLAIILDMCFRFKLINTFKKFTKFDQKVSSKSIFPKLPFPEYFFEKFYIRILASAPLTILKS